MQARVALTILSTTTINPVLRQQKQKTTLVHRIFSPNADDGSNTNEAGVWGKFYVNGNVFDNTCPEIQSNSTSMKNIESVNSNNWNGIHPNGTPTGGMATIKSLVAFDSPEISRHTAEKAYEKVLNYVGASYLRDAIDPAYHERNRGWYIYV